MLFNIFSTGNHKESSLLIKDALLLLVAWIAFIQTRNWLRWRAFHKWAVQNRCGDTPALPNKLPGGIERLFIFFTNLKDLDFLEDVIRAQDRTMGRHTYRIHSLFNYSMITTSDPENIQAILATKFHDFDLGPYRKEMFFEMLGNGIFTAEGKEWAHYRHMIKPQFTRVQIEDLESAERHLDVLFKSLPDVDGRGWIEEVDLMPFLFRFTMDVSTEFLFGESVNTQSKILHSMDSSNSTELLANMDFDDAMNYALEYITWRFRVSKFSFLAPSKTKRFQHACNTVKTFADRFVRLALDPEYKAPEGKYVFLNELKKETQDPVELRDQVLHLLIAGRDTTSSLLSWTLLLLARHANEFANLRAAIIAQFGTESSPKEELTFASLKACKPLTHILYEVSRLYPVISMNARVALKDTFLPTGGGVDRKQPVAVMKGEQVGYSAYVMQRRHDIWGEDADEFRPARWEGRKLGWDFIAFSGGPRVCVGQQYALNEAAFVIVKFLQRFDRIEALDMKGKLDKGLTITLAPGKGVIVKMHKAAS